MNVQELMSKPAITCREGDSLHTAAGMMRNRDCGAIPVVNDKEAIIGLLTDRDICLAAHSAGRSLSEILVAEVIDCNVFSVGPNDSIQQAEDIMRQHQVRRLPVIDDRDRVIGMLSLNDIAREGERELALRKKEIRSEEVLQTLAAICQPTAKNARATV